MKKVCLVIGAGAGIGGNVGKRFAAEGYHTVLCRRRDKEGLDRMVSEIEAAGGSAKGVILNAVEPDAIEDLVARTEREAGPIDTVIFNLGAQIGNRTLEETTYKAFEQCWQIASMSLFRLAKSVCPLMVERGGGNILVTSAT
ncbi:MAG: SDR family NAD(P)-dependent oxidoreductase, partial [Flavobacteriales bacterium]|nr:SDR family NAD(P)-dependent oxidoreductase [Flavobacteriales bacterium]